MWLRLDVVEGVSATGFNHPASAARNGAARRRRAGAMRYRHSRCVEKL
jgi:hypothetical protein